MTVLIVSTEQDEHARAVGAEVAALGGRAEVLDVSAFPQELRLRMSYDCCGSRSFAIGVNGSELDLAGCGAVWWRRPQPPRISDEIVRPTHRLFAANEAQEALAGLWHALDAFWVNDPALDNVAHRKPYQLRVAQEAGLEIPPTLITNDVDAARRFVDARGYRDVIYKAFSATEQEWRETRLLRAEELSLLDNVRYAPVIFQGYVDAVHDLRVTIVGDEIFAAAIHSQESEYPVDFRMDMARAEIEAVRLPDHVEDLLRELMKRLGLAYGAIDMRRTPDDRWVFLEINPAGQWLFVERASGQPIAAALARLLVERDAGSNGGG